MSNDVVPKIMKLWRSSPAACYRFNPIVGTSFLSDGAYDYADVVSHVNGEQGLGLIPIWPESNSCYWGALDIDTQQDSTVARDLSEVVDKLSLPLCVSRSKSGGAHLWLFLSDFVTAANLRVYLKQFADTIKRNYALPDGSNIEIFPKQDTLPPLTREEQVRLETFRTHASGNGLNIPMFGLDTDSNTRTLFVRGDAVSPETWIKHATSRMVSPGKLSVVTYGSHDAAPPCLQHIIREGLEEGSRNTAMYNISVYAHRAFGDGARDICLSVNSEFDPPLMEHELTSILRSTGRREYRYQCDQEPLAGLCDKEECKKRKFGVTSKQADEDSMLNCLSVDDWHIRKIRMEETVYLLTYQGQELPMMSEGDALANPDKIRFAVFSLTNEMPKPMKALEWQMFVSKLAKSGKVDNEDMPEEATQYGLIKTCVLNHLSICMDIESAPNDPTQHRACLDTGYPVVSAVRGKKYAFTSHNAVRTAMMQNNIRTATESVTWMFLRRMGFTVMSLKVNGAPERLYALPIDGTVLEPRDLSQSRPTNMFDDGDL